ncbi:MULTISPECIES: 5,6-dimethylbenzimidazole synthase [Rhodopseudomonas]|uniref:Cob(II)yrinic acid a,c-diamide reductase n=1 Tax=Rhodopseudomonas palustris TaxID=1076 RepID=A0A0D7F1Z8_RHOPL|nr:MULTISPECIES: 5,6-dimethylbenzimidazole synthase [Rhodopseudomonas]KIZ46871.1 cob(II)yrinic acid a,c-diamide reductase [Rhodopseudomonas palustris]MDF3813067.1 5,6-dimethylbenzimidazole synthase [Rhodopseudomonas sp. BAL398]WOK16538.1 5,6-dimethylbenzimidazole synthase [Rhodopseudomonas sp. BAL398]
MTKTLPNAAIANAAPPRFDAKFQAQLAELIAWRRDVRRFRPDPVAPELIERLLDLAQLAPSVGNSQPWRWVSVDSAAMRQKIRGNFVRSNDSAAANYRGARAELYARLKLEGIDIAPRQFALFCDHGTAQGSGVGCQSMPEALDYSVAVMIETFWLTARAAGLGVGWVSILDPVEVTADLDVPQGWKFIAYLCVGWPVEEHIDPELVRHHWQDRTGAGRQVISR